MLAWNADGEAKTVSFSSDSDRFSGENYCPTLREPLVPVQSPTGFQFLFRSVSYTLGVQLEVKLPRVMPDGQCVKILVIQTVKRRPCTLDQGCQLSRCNLLVVVDVPETDAADWSVSRGESPGLDSLVGR